MASESLGDTSLVKALHVQHTHKSYVFFCLNFVSLYVWFSFMFWWILMTTLPLLCFSFRFSSCLLRCVQAATLHGFAGYFHSRLFGDVCISIVPKTFSEVGATHKLSKLHRAV